MNRNWMITGWLSLLVFFTEVISGGAQEPTRQQLPPPAALQKKPSAVDAKADSDPRSAAAFLEGAYHGERPPEAVRMLAAMLRGGRMGPGQGWFGPAENRYSWSWLARHCGIDPAKGAITRKSFPGPDALFTRLDRDKNGTITPADFDWSDSSPYLQTASLADRLFRELNTKANGRLTKTELLQFFESAAQGKDHVVADDFREALLAGMFGGSGPGDAPKPDALIRGLFSGELGSLSEGPKFNDPAPDFTLKTVDGKSKIELAKLIGPKPVVLVFGSFT